MLTSSLSEVAENNSLYIYVLNITEKMLEVDPQLINVAKISENYLTEINQLIQVTDTPNRKSQPA